MSSEHMASSGSYWTDGVSWDGSAAHLVSPSPADYLPREQIEPESLLPAWADGNQNAVTPALVRSVL